MLLSSYFIAGIVCNTVIAVTVLVQRQTVAQPLIFVWMTISFVLLLSRSLLFSGWLIVIPTMGTIFGLMTIKHLVRQNASESNARRQAWLLLPQAQIISVALLVTLNVAGLVVHKGMF